ncbi:MAG: VOC family protein [Pseudomonadota bacterium]
MELDHIAVAGASLQDAAAYVEDALGIRLQDGGKHDKFGTHNRLLGLSDGLYLEAIATDPEAPNPGRPRWFNLDNFSGSPRLTNWICRVPDLNAALDTLPAGLGEAIDLARGDLRWSMAVPQTGVLPYDDVCPAIIQWHGDLHPAKMLTPSGCTLRRLNVSHPRARELAQVLGTLSHVDLHTGPAGLQAEFQTPDGIRVLE